MRYTVRLWSPGASHPACDTTEPMRREAVGVPEEEDEEEENESSDEAVASAGAVPPDRPPPHRPPDQARSTSSGPSPTARPRRVAAVLVEKGARVAVFLLGLAAVVTAIVLWLAPTPSRTSSTVERSTTAATGADGRRATTAVTKSTATTEPGSQRSATVIVALLAVGAGLVIAGGLWDRIQELAIGNVTVKLLDAALAAPRIALVDAAAAHVDSLGSTSANAIAAEVSAVSAQHLDLVRVDLRGDDLWAPLNLVFFVMLLARRSSAEAITFTGVLNGEAGAYIGIASVPRLADRFAADDPIVALALRSTDGIPLDAQFPDTVGAKFFADLQRRDANRIPGQETQLVDARRLGTMAGPVLLTASVAAEDGPNLSRRQQRIILAYPLNYVPITSQRRLESIVSKPRLAENIARSVVGS